jgi:hypothetical protein
MIKIILRAEIVNGSNSVRVGCTRIPYNNVGIVIDPLKEPCLVPNTWYCSRGRYRGPHGVPRSTDDIEGNLDLSSPVSFSSASSASLPETTRVQGVIAFSSLSPSFLSIDTERPTRFATRAYSNPQPISRRQNSHSPEHLARDRVDSYSADTPFPFLRIILLSSSSVAVSDGDV